MAAEAEAARESRAKVIAASGERNAAKALREAADIINSTSTAMQVRLIRLSRDLHNGNREINFLSHQKLQLRYLQTLNSIASEKESTIIFPLPIEMMSCFMQDL